MALPKHRIEANDDQAQPGNVVDFPAAGIPSAPEPADSSGVHPRARQMALIGFVALTVAFWGAVIFLLTR